jgi:uncharacterized cupin superfamily protein
MPKLDLASLPTASGTRYPPPHDAPCKDRRWQALGAAAGLTQFGVNLVTLAPGVWSSQRHWHAVEDEFVMVLKGRPTLVEDEGPILLDPGDCAAWKGGAENGHCLKNETNEDVVLLVVGGRSDDDYGAYPDIDMQFLPGRYSGGGGFRKKDGSTF